MTGSVDVGVGGARDMTSPEASGPLPLAEAKLAAPRQRAALVPRPRLLEALDADPGAALTLVAAPVGYGKTTIVRAWCQTLPGSFAWLTLDAEDNDPVRLWSYLAVAVDRVRGGLGGPALRRLRAPGSSVEGAADELMNAIGTVSDGVVLVLDDFQAITDEDCLGSIDHAIRHLPQSARLVIITRADPPLGLARMRARGTLLELRARDLAFTRDEAAQLLVGREGLALGADAVASLQERTEGWPAALFLASQWLRRVDDPAAAVRDFGGDHRFVADYLAQEVIAALDSATREFVLGASVLGRFTAELCDGVFARDDSAEMLAAVERGNLFVVRLEHGGWFRIHPLFAEFARHRLQATSPGAAADIHRRAAVWCRSRGLLEEAAEHAAAAGEDDLLAELLEEHHLALIRSGRAATLLRAAQRLPDDVLAARPALAAGAATAAIIVGREALTVRRLLALARRAQDEGTARVSPYAEAVRCMVEAAFVGDDVSRAVRAGRRCVEISQAAEDQVVVASLGGLARALYMAGDDDGAWDAAGRAVAHPDAERRAPGHAFAHTTLAFIAADRGWGTLAREHAERAGAIVRRTGSSRTWLGANAAVARGRVLAAEGALADAERELARAETFFRDEVATVHHSWLLVQLAGVRVCRGRLDDAEAALRAVGEAAHELRDAGRVPALAGAALRQLGAARARAGDAVTEAPSQAEQRVLALLATDLTVREIGERLFVSSNTVRSHMRALYRKLHVSSRADAVARAEVLGLLERVRSPG